MMQIICELIKCLQNINYSKAREGFWEKDLKALQKMQVHEVLAAHVSFIFTRSGPGVADG